MIFTEKYSDITRRIELNLIFYYTSAIQFYYPVYWTNMKEKKFYNQYEDQNGRKISLYTTMNASLLTANSPHGNKSDSGPEYKSITEERLRKNCMRKPVIQYLVI